jgi:hypothetical protein
MARSRILPAVLATALALPIGLAGPGPAVAGSHTACRVVVTDLGPTLRIVFHVRSPAPERRYRIRITVDGETVFRDRLRTNEDRRLRVRVYVPDEPGRELVQGRARDLATGSLCLASVLAPVA